MLRAMQGSWRGSAAGVWLGAWLLLAVALARPAAAQPSELWYVIELDGQRAGWQLERTEVEGDRITTVSEMRLEIRRGEVAMAVAIESEFVETADHEPVEWRVSQQLGATPMETRYRFGDGEVEVVSEQAGERTRRTVPLEDRAWLTPAAAGELLAARLEAMPKEISLTTVEPMTGLTPVRLTLEGLERAEVDVMGRTVPAVRATMRSSASPGTPMEVYLDERGRQVRSTAQLMGMTLVTVAADRALARAELDPPELMARTLVPAGRAIEGARRAQRGVYVLRVREGRLGELPEAGAQRVERLDGSRVRVVVDLSATPRRAEVEDQAPYLAASGMINGDDPRIRRLAERATPRREAGDAEVAERLRRMVHEHIDEKDLSVGFASASEVARTRQGDCTEHAALLAALLRAREIPSRVVSGLVYVPSMLGREDVFGYHMWTQALLEVEGERRWVDLDATTPEPFDATHIVLMTSDLGDGGSSNALVELAPLLGRLEVEVEGVDGDG